MFVCSCVFVRLCALACGMWCILLAVLHTLSIYRMHAARMGLHAVRCVSRSAARTLCAATAQGKWECYGGCCGCGRRRVPRSCCSRSQCACSTYSSRSQRCRERPNQCSDAARSDAAARALVLQMSVREGYSFRRLDGSTEPQERLRIVDEYNTTDSIFLFLISTKARFSFAY